MNLYEIIFSPTGGTKAVADALASGLGGGASIIDLCAPDFDPSTADIPSDAICIIAAPAYGGRVPALAVTRLAQLKGNGAKAVLAAVYGNREFEDTLLELKNTAAAAGFVPFAGVGAIAEHSIARQFAAGRPDADDVAELKNFAANLLSRATENPSGELVIPGNFPYKEFKGSSAKPSASDSCTQCGLCAEQCPACAIPADHPEQTDPAKCISCMRCISVCPANARALNPDLMTGIGQMLSKVASGRKNNQFFL